MFHPLFFHNGLHSCHCHDVLADAMALAAALKVEQDLQRAWREEREGRQERSDDKDDSYELAPEVYRR